MNTGAGQETSRGGNYWGGWGGDNTGVDSRTVCLSGTWDGGAGRAIVWDYHSLKWPSLHYSLNTQECAQADFERFSLSLRLI